MILNVNRSEISVLLLHMTITRKNVRNGFKKNYGKQEGKEILGSFDEVKMSLEMIIDALEEDNMDINAMYELHYNINEVQMVDSFLSWYIVELENTLNAATKGNITDEDIKQIASLKAIKGKTDRLKEVHKVV